MNYRQKCKVHGAWAFVKNQGDAAFYAVCQNCSFGYNASEHIIGEHSFIIRPSLKKLYKYCPNCGLKMHPYDGLTVYRFDMDGNYMDKKNYGNDSDTQS